MNLKLLFAALITAISLQAQLLNWNPVYLTSGDSVEIIFDASEGNQGLMGYTGTVYAHTGVITNLSSGPSDWKYVKTNWGQNSPETKLESLGNDKWVLRITPSIRGYYNVPANEEILEMAFVFRSGELVGGSYKEGKTSAGGDIFLPLYLGVSIITPSFQPYFAEIGDTINVSAVASETTTSLELLVNGNLIYQVSNDSLNYDLIVTENGKKWVKVVAYENGNMFAADSFYYVIVPDIVTEPLPNGIREGITYTSGNSATLSLFAPFKEFVFVIGDFNNWEADPAYFMKRTPDDSTYWIEITGMQPGEEYGFQYLVDGNLRIADPYSEKILDPYNDHYISSTTYPGLKPYPKGKTTEAVGVLIPGSQPYNWQVTDFQKPKKTDLVIYELLLRDFITEHNYQTLIDTLSYLESLGVNAIELMPINEFEGNESWGYNPSFYFAVDKYYGTKEKFQEFIDECHLRGIAVIIDIALNHTFGQSPFVRLYSSGSYGPPTAQNPWLNVTARHPFNVGYDFNHESGQTKKLVDRVTSYWLTEFKIDGFRFDLSKGFTQVYSGDNVGLWGNYDQSRINLWKRISTHIRSVSSDAFIILEHFADNSEEKELSNNGMMLWGNMNYEYNEATMGYNSNLSWGSYQQRGWSEPNLVTYMESHDEERLVFKNLQYGNSSGNYSVKNLATALDRIKLAAAFFFTVPGPKMLWQFGELGYDYSINWPSGTDADRLTPKPPRWDYLNDYERHYLLRVFQELINIRKEYDVFETSDYYFDATPKLKKLQLNHSSMDINIIGNFDVVQGSINPAFQTPGKWYNFFSGDSVNITNTSDPIALQPGEFRIYSTVKLPTPEEGILLGNDRETLAEISYDLSQNYPNPFNPETRISFSLGSSGFVSVKVFNVLGQEIRTLLSAEKNTGVHSLLWDGKDNSGNPVASGAYIYRIESEGFISAKKMMLLR
ncbi:MAG: T9SS type A sorting domain-containing protein [Ignavibacteriales bacterium]|nr:T9SS type A sorting domain-containing protein [Ignavibacteriales bacterium]MCF8314840.1 T9SS type A sorting domain-containing protein [Ignavibacteriales bacterium]MCF8436211.1 T9SS type A sorting domain-containing protein [Ignavibacteriales bacterium]